MALGIFLLTLGGTEEARGHAVTFASWVFYGLEWAIKRVACIRVGPFAQAAYYQIFQAAAAAFDCMTEPQPS